MALAHQHSAALVTASLHTVIRAQRHSLVLYHVPMQHHAEDRCPLPGKNRLVSLVCAGSRCRVSRLPRLHVTRQPEPGHAADTGRVARAVRALKCFWGDRHLVTVDSVGVFV